MKWLRRKPSLRVHCWTPVVCLIALIPAALWIGGPPNYRASTPGRWIPDWISGKVVYTGMRPPAMCYVTRVDGKMQMLGDGARPTEDMWREHREDLYLYRLSTDAFGLLAPTRMRIEHHLFRPAGFAVGYPQEFLKVSRRWGLGLAPDEDGFMAIDPRIERMIFFDESRPIWNGYAVNAVVLLAATGILWSLAWTPRQIRHLVRRKRYLQGLCPLCKYDLRATPDQCPECGWGVLRTACGLPIALSETSRDAPHKGEMGWGHEDESEEG